MGTKIHIKLLVSLFLGLWINNVLAQELLIGLGENTRITKQKPHIKTKALKSTVLSLPFVDDFAKPSNYAPDNEKWIDNYVFINNSFAINPPTIGVATFDAFDNAGRLYQGAGPSVFAADTLTSRAINLAYPAADSIYLSFFIQPGGYGDMPEYTDTLTLQFRTGEGKWVSVWQASANVKDSTITTRWKGVSTRTKVKDIDTGFFRVHLKIDNLQFLHAAFQFRYINYASIAINRNAPGRSTSADHWHLDYVYLDRNRRANNLNLPDVTIAVPQTPLNSVFESIPAIHLSSQDAINDLFPDPMVLSVTYRNLGWGAKSIARNFRIRPLYGTGATVQFSGGAENIYDNQTVQFDYLAPKYNFTTTSDSAAFEIRSYLYTDNDPSFLRTELRYNDTTRYTQYFRDYYAYDDGTAENGYGLFGNNTANGKIAIQFQSYKNDSIRGVYMYFNRTVNNANVIPFYVTVWSDFNGMPDTVMYKGRVDKPAFADSLNKYIAYKFDKPIAIQKGAPFYVGWTQMTDDFLNIGFDRNRNHQVRNFFNIYDTWESSIYEGSVMLRPIFTRTAADFPNNYVPTIPPSIITDPKSAFTVYPNPVSGGRLYMIENDHQQTPVKAQRVDVYDTIGKLVYTTNSADGSINIDSLTSGVYIVRVWENNTIKGVKRIVVTK